MDATRRRRQPVLVRAALLDAAVQEAMLHGLGNVTVLSVADRAGVSKGALFHHFANRQDLLEAAYAECLARFGDALDVLVATDPVPHGRFTRAYVRATFEAMHAEDANWARFSLSALVEPAFAALWRRWLDERLAQVPAERSAPGCGWRGWPPTGTGCRRWAVVWLRAAWRRSMPCASAWSGLPTTTRCRVPPTTDRALSPAQRVALSPARYRATRSSSNATKAGSM